MCSGNRALDYNKGCNPGLKISRLPTIDSTDVLMIFTDAAYNSKMKNLHMVIL